MGEVADFLSCITYELKGKVVESVILCVTLGGGCRLFSDCRPIIVSCVHIYRYCLMLMRSNHSQAGKRDLKLNGTTSFALGRIPTIVTQN